MKIVVNGCFDLLHEGHKYLLSKAFQWADYGPVLILLNSDQSVQVLKGLDRPIDTYSIRAEKIKDYKKLWSFCNRQYPAIDIVEFTTEEELESLINNFQPDIILKGNDRPDVRDIVGSINWPVCILPRVKEISTTNCLQTK